MMKTIFKKIQIALITALSLMLIHGPISLANDQVRTSHPQNPSALNSKTSRSGNSGKIEIPIESESGEQARVIHSWDLISQSELHSLEVLDQLRNFEAIGMTIQIFTGSDQKESLEAVALQQALNQQGLAVSDPTFFAPASENLKLLKETGLQDIGGEGIGTARLELNRSIDDRIYEAPTEKEFLLGSSILFYKYGLQHIVWIAVLPPETSGFLALGLATMQAFFTGTQQIFLKAHDNAFSKKWFFKKKVGDEKVSYFEEFFRRYFYNYAQVVAIRAATGPLGDAPGLGSVAGWMDLALLVGIIGGGSAIFGIARDRILDRETSWWTSFNSLIPIILLFALDLGGIQGETLIEFGPMAITTTKAFILGTYAFFTAWVLSASEPVQSFFESHLPELQNPALAASKALKRVAQTQESIAQATIEKLKSHWAEQGAFSRMCSHYLDPPRKSTSPADQTNDT
jgi:hypothetical protein